MYKKNVVFAKFGKSIAFDSSKWGAHGGDNEAPYLLFALAAHNPDTMFWLIGKSDFSKVYPDGLSDLPNIKHIWNEEYWPEPGINPTVYVRDVNDDKIVPKYISYITDNFEKMGITPDFGIFLSGITWNVHIPNVVKRQDKPDVWCRTLEAAIKYSGPLYHFINTTMMPWTLVMTDPRQSRCIPRELVNMPQKILSQSNEWYIKPGQYAYWPAGVYQTTSGCKQTYMYSELMNLLSREPIEQVYNLDENYFKEKSGLNIIMNEGCPGNPPERYLKLKQFVLSDDTGFDISVYGKWSEEITNKDSHFKGIIQPQLLGDVLHKTKYTFCIPIKKGWVTSKFIEMVHFGVIPFLHYEYASEVNCSYIKKFPWLFVRNKSELLEKIAELEADYGKYFELITQLRNVLFAKDKYDLYNGTFIANVYNKNWPQIFEAPKESDLICRLGKKKERENPLNSFF